MAEDVRCRPPGGSKLALALASLAARTASPASHLLGLALAGRLATPSRTSAASPAGCGRSPSDRRSCCSSASAVYGSARCGIDRCALRTACDRCRAQADLLQLSAPPGRGMLPRGVRLPQHFLAGHVTASSGLPERCPRAHTQRCTLGHFTQRAIIPEPPSEALTSHELLYSPRALLRVHLFMCTFAAP